MVKKEKITIIKQTTQELLDKLEVPVTFTLEEKEGVVNLNLQTDNPGLFIGYHGQTLFALQLILSMIIYRRTGEWTKILVDIDNYRQKRAEILEKMAFSAAQRVKLSHQEQELPPMSAFERRIIHLALINESEIETESRGEGKERRVVVRPKK